MKMCNKLLEIIPESVVFIVLSEVRLMEKDKYHIITLTCDSPKEQIQIQEKFCKTHCISTSCRLMKYRKQPTVPTAGE